MLDYPTAEERGEALRRRYGIDGTRGDAQDVDHPFHGPRDEGCLVCGLALSYYRHGEIHLLQLGLYACDRAGAKQLRVPIPQRTLDPAQATCPECVSHADG